MIFHPAFALPLLLIGWFGFSTRKTVIGAAISLLILWQGVLAVAAVVAFEQESLKESSILVWVFSFMSAPSLIGLLVLSLRQYYAKRTVNWSENEEIKR